MRVAWFTPFSKKSAIGKYNKLLTNELIDSIDVDLWLPQRNDLFPTRLKKFFFTGNDNLTHVLKKYDVIIYNLGNFLGFHKDIYEISRKIKGVIILHDYVLHHFFADYYLNYRKNQWEYLNDIRKYYGKKARQRALDGISGKQKPIWETEEVLQYPFFEKAIENSYGVIACSKFLAKKIAWNPLRPVQTIYNPFYPSKELILIKKKMNKRDFGFQEEKLILGTVGHVIKPKKIEIIITILAKNKQLSDKVIFLVLGDEVDPAYSTFLKSLVKQHSLEKTVKFLGYVPDEVLHEYESVVDIFINLRFPFTGGASWSIIEELHFGKPTIVSDTGFFSEFPDDAVIKIKPYCEEEDLLYSLKKLLADKKVRIEIGKNGKQFAINNFRVDTYCKEFEKFAKKILFLRKLFPLFY